MPMCFSNRACESSLSSLRSPAIGHPPVSADERAYSPAKQRLRARQWERLWESNLSYDEQSDPTARGLYILVTATFTAGTSIFLGDVRKEPDYRGSFARAHNTPGGIQGNLQILLCVACMLSPGQSTRKCPKWSSLGSRFEVSNTKDITKAGL
jgi:hypothetical protein